MTTLDLQVGAGNGDAHELGDLSQFVDTHTYLHCYASELGTNDEWTRHIGVRFTSVGIPVGATVDVAYLEFYVRLAASVNVHIYAEDVDNADNFVTTAAIQSRARTTATTNWQSQSQTANTWYQTGSLVTQLQEVVDRPGWVANNAVVFLLIAELNSGFQAQQEFRSYEGDSTKAPKLHVEYTSSSGSSGGKGPVSFWHLPFGRAA